MDYIILEYLGCFLAVLGFATMPFFISVILMLSNGVSTVASPYGLRLLEPVALSHPCPTEPCILFSEHS
jgi:hypothetical protein